MNIYKYVENPFGPFRYIVEGSDAFFVLKAAEAFEKAIDFYSRVPGVMDIGEQLIICRQDIQRQYNVSIKPDL